MKKAMLGFIATAMSLLATTANGAGDIRAIEPCDQYGYVIPNGSMAQPYTVGETAYFRIRLENLNSKECHQFGYSNPWTLQYKGLMDPVLAWATQRPQVGVIVSGVFRGATVESVLSPENESWCTDILCSYTVRPGDLALPMTLADSTGKEAGTGAGTRYYFDTYPTKSGVWNLVGSQRVGPDDSGTLENEWV